jgi:hypothetical protein
MSRADTRSVVLNALATKRRRDVAELESELLAAGQECPCDSQWLVKAGVAAAKTMGVRLRVRAADAWAFKSVETLTTFLDGLVDQKDAA